MNEGFYIQAYKTDSKMKEIIKMQGERLKILNKDYKKLQKEQQKTLREMIHFRDQARKKEKVISKMTNNIEMEITNSCEDCQLREKCLEENCIIFRIKNIIEKENK